MTDLLNQYGEEFLKAVIEALPIGVWIVGPTGEVEFGNKAGREIWGGVRHVGPENYSEYKAWWDDSGKELRPEDWGAYRALRKGEASVGEILKIEAFNQIRKVIWHAAVPVKDGTGKLLGVVVVNQDITRAREIEAKYRNLLESAHDGIVAVNERGMIELVNRRAEVLFGYESRELIGKPIELLVPERLREAHLHHRARYMASPVPQSMGSPRYLAARRKDGSEFPVDISLSPVAFGGGTFVTAIVRDASVHHRVETQTRFIAESSRLLNEVLGYRERLQKVADLVVPQLADCCVVRLATEQYPEYVACAHRDGAKLASLKTILGRVSIRPDSPWGANAVMRSGISQLIAEVKPAMLQEVGTGKEDYELLLQLGIRSWISVPLFARGRTIGALLLFMTESGRRFNQEDLEFAELAAVRWAMALDNARLYSEAQRAIQAREEILAIVSHDLKNPLTVTATNAAMIPRLIAGQEKRAELEKIAMHIQRSSERMARLIGDLLDYSKIQAGTFSVEARRTALRSFVMELLDSMRPQATEKRIELLIRLTEEDPCVICDPDRISQVLSNLVGNSIKFTPEGGRIEVTSAVEGDQLRFSVSDTGPGLTCEQLEHVFERYWQAEATAQKGAGLGLAISQAIIRAHRGTIWAESEPGRGSVFSFKIPLC